ncbi:SH3-like domain-containing protein [Spirulina major]|uniref:SH3-like domain-containing protein n=1 Tax=Spirulina major TaxID=270636 RepID=UPI000A027668|nr:SH3-like domain-containing protein [Spirulina major]
MQDIPSKAYHQHIPHNPDSTETICTAEETIGFFEKQITSIHNLMRAKKQLPSFDSIRRAAEEVDGRFATHNFTLDIPTFLRDRLPAYGERRILAVETVLCELNYLTPAELRQALERAEPPAATPKTPKPTPDNPYAPAIDHETYPEARYQVGDCVQVRDQVQPGHIRTPLYLLGKTGRIAQLQGFFLNPEDLAHFKSTVLRLPLYLVEFDMLEIWGDRCPPRSQKDKLRVEIYEPWVTSSRHSP